MNSLHLHCQRCEPAVEADHHHRLIWLLKLFENSIHTRPVNRQRFLAENMLLQLQRMDDLAAVLVMTGQDGDQIHILILEYLIFFTGAVLEAELLAGIAGIQTGTRRDPHRADPADLCHRGQESGICIQPCAQNTQVRAGHYRS